MQNEYETLDFLKFSPSNICKKEEPSFIIMMVAKNLFQIEIIVFKRIALPTGTFLLLMYVEYVKN